MPLYFLHVVDGSVIVRDPEGTELPTVAAAIELAAGSAREIMADDLRANRPLGMKRHIAIHDENDDYITALPFSSALPHERK